MAVPVVWRLSAEHSAAAGAVLGRAFMDEPILVAGFPDPVLRERYCPLRWAAGIRYACRFGEAWAVGSEPGDIGGATFWVYEPAPESTPELRAELGFPPADDEADACMSRIISIAHIAEAEYGVMPAVWRGLWMIGVEPARQGQGLGSVLIKRMLDDAAAAGEPLALFTDRPINVPFYEKAGMEMVWTGASDDGVVPLWSFRKG